MADVTDGNAVLTERVSDHILLVTINRPEARNAINGAVTRGLANAVKMVEEDPTLWGAILTGAGDMSFSAGADLKEIQAGNAASLLTPEGGFAGFVYAKKTKFWIAAVNGFALGGGMELAMACHLRVSSEKAKFGQPEINLGLIPGFGGTQRLSRLVGKGVAKELVLTGRMLDAAEAKALGLVAQVFPAGSFMAECRKVARSLAAKGRVSLRAAKGAIDRGFNLDLRNACLLEVDAFALCFASPDAHEGARAFLEKRQPKFL